MIEKIILDYLNSVLNVAVYAETPPNPPEHYVLIEKTGGSRLNFIDSATVAVQSYAPTLYEAAALNDIVKRAMFDIIALPSVSACRLNSDYNFTDTSTKKYRYQAVFDLTY